MNVLIDTDVILDFFFDRKPHSGYSAIILDRCERGLLKGFVTPVIMSNVYYLLRRTAKHKQVIEKLKQFSTIVQILPMDSRVVEKALYADFKDFEDALQNFSAVNSGKIELIITRNVKDYKKSSLAVFTPEDFVSLKKL